MITGYSLYVILHFPLNTYLFKVTSIKKQKTISIYFAFIILFFVFVFYYIASNSVHFTYQMLLVTVWIYIFILLIVKAVIIFNGKEGEPGQKDEIIPEESNAIPL